MQEPQNEDEESFEAKIMDTNGPNAAVTRFSAHRRNKRNGACNGPPEKKN
jgi:hypothetical protein